MIRLLLGGILTLLLSYGSLAHAATFYVATTGSDANSCATAQSDTTPKLTIASGLGCLTVAGDILEILGGTYGGSSNLIYEVSFGATGTAAAHMTVRGRAGQTVTLNAVGGTNLIRFQDGSRVYIDIENIVADAINNGNPQSDSVVSCNGASHHLTFRNVTVKNGPRNGYLCSGTNQQILGGAVHTNGRTQNANANGIYATFTDSVIDGVEVYDNEGYGVRIFNTGETGISSNSVVQNSFIHDNGRNHGIGGTSTSPSGGGGVVLGDVNNKAINNVITDNYWGLNIDIWDQAVNNRDAKVWNNTLYHNDYGLQIGTNHSAASVKNNIIYNHVFFNNIEDLSSNASLATNPLTNPTFVDAATDDFGLQAGSNAINACTDVGLPYNGASPDCGAHETFVHATCAVEAATPTIVNITFTNNVAPPLLPSTSVTGFTAREDAGAKTVSSVARVGDNQMNVTVSAGFSAGTAIDYSYSTSTGNVTDSALIGDTMNQRLNAITNQSCTNNVSGAPAHVWTQKYFRFHGLRGTEASPVVLPHTAAANNVNINVIPSGKFRVRIKVACTSGDCPSIGMVLRYSLNSGSYTAVPDSFGADNIRFFGTSATDSDIPTQGVATTELLTSDHASMVTGAITRTSSAVPAVNLTQNSETEVEYIVELDSDTVVGSTYDFRLYNQDTTVLNTYTVTPRVTVITVTSGGGF